jgi:hypothetical protein
MSSARGGLQIEWLKIVAAVEASVVLRTGSSDDGSRRSIRGGRS